MSHLSSADSKTAPRSPAGNAESVREILTRLGPPPADIADRWCRQARAIADDIALRTGQPLPPIDLADWFVDDHGTVGVRSSPTNWEFPAVDDSVSSQPTTASEVDAINQQRLADFRNQIGSEAMPSQTSHDQPATSDTPERIGDVVVDASDNPVGDIDEDDGDAASTKTDARKRRRRWPTSTPRIAAAALIVLVLALGWWLAGNALFVADSPDTILPDSKSSETSDAAGSSPGDARSDTVSPGNASSKTFDTLPPQTLESFSITDAVVDSDNLLVDPTSVLPFDALVPDRASPTFPPGLETSPQSQSAGSISLSNLDDDADDDPVDVTSIDGSSLSVGVGDADVPTADALAMHPETEAPESPQRVRTVKVQSFQLPAVEETVETQPIGDWPASDTVLDRLSLEFPLPIPIAMKRSPASSANPNALFDFRDTRNQTLLALLCRDSDQLAFQWQDTAKSSSQSSLLLHGRLRDSTGNVIYFRPRIEADAWALSFDQSDFHPSWDLGGLLPAKVTRLKIDFDLPDEVEEAWIEPIDAASPRRTSGIAVLALKDNENVRVGLRFDIKCTTKLACQIRIAGRLDPAFAWQTFTESGLANFANSLLSQSDLVQQQIASIEAIYDRADTDARRILRPRRTAIKTHAEQLTELSRRVAELQSLLALLQTSAKLRFQVFVRWSDSEQVILAQQE
ncbi:transmembrane protein [Rhodopirellula maiorica SM1]|uniref:Transmembrane protein n=1 Tax=Rhodopirellula maiorica SM1 TaxID=1265738 RepID=M5RMS0_9BACT|nr:hypothetical protein [Rhodopirellula maiorica]EMI20623.1 transmembrane protein [Rhodopirellula maiorica SM1]